MLEWLLNEIRMEVDRLEKGLKYVFLDTQSKKDLEDALDQIDNKLSALYNEYIDDFKDR